jgi:sterol desaturase/sphingolipid hydroxylase (fatty acid hydroxylase superfamily)
MDHMDTFIVTGLLVAFGLIELVVGVWRGTGRRRDDWIIDFISLSQLAFLIKPAIVLVSAFLLGWLLPSYQGALAGTAFWPALLLVMIPDDFMHYWYHRLAHENHWLWRWHRTHHTTPSYHISIAFRENWLWLSLMPGLWWGAVMVYLGLGYEFIIGTTIVGAHNVWIHNGLDFDRKLYRLPVIGRLYSALEHIFQSPSEHRGHHGLGEGGVPFGNYGQLLFIWDILFGTATFPKDQRPERYGVIHETLDPWYAQLWWPFIKSPKKGSDIG